MRGRLFYENLKVLEFCNIFPENVSSGLSRSFFKPEKAFLQVLFSIAGICVARYYSKYIRTKFCGLYFFEKVVRLDFFSCTSGIELFLFNLDGELGCIDV